MTYYLADASDSRPSPAELRGAGYSGLIGYVSPSPAKNITKPEVDALLADSMIAGIIWESSAQRAASSGAAGGAVDGPESVRQVQALGFRSGMILLCAEDPTQIPQSQWMAAGAYFRAAVPAFTAAGFDVCGGYGGHGLLTYLAGFGLISVKWQPQTWGDHSTADLIQMVDAVPLSNLGGRVDCNLVLNPAIRWPSRSPAGPVPSPVPNPQPATGPTVGPPTEWSDAMLAVPVHIPMLDDQGNGYVDVPQAAGKPVSVEFNGSDPAAHGYPSQNQRPGWEALTLGGVKRVVIYGGTPKGELDLTVLVFG